MSKSAQRWKNAEREIAKLLSGYRLPNNGYGQPDVVAGRIAVQVKTRMELPNWFTDAVDQSILDANATQQPVVIFNLVNQGVKARRFLVVDLDHIMELEDVS